MRRWMAIVVVLVLGAGLTVAQKPPKDEKEKPRFVPPEVVATVEPNYPPNVLAWGTVVLEVTINQSGDVEKVRVVRGVPALTEQAERAVKKWKFRAATLNDKPMEASLPVVFIFNRGVNYPAP